jgi:Cd2+/Zn2+-exporting ATPase
MNFEQEHQHFSQYLPAVITFAMLIAGLIFEHSKAFENLAYGIFWHFWKSTFSIIWFLTAYFIIAFPVLKQTLRAFLHKDFFNEFSLMSLATIGAICIGEFPEAVAVMLFYTVGEHFQEAAVNRAKRSIKALLDVRPDAAFVKRGGEFLAEKPENVKIGDIIQVKVGEKVPLDGKMLNEFSSFNTSALTGESVPRKIRQGEQALAGMVNLDYVAEIQVDKLYSDSSLAKILDLAQNAVSRKAKTELFIRKFAKIYTPIVFALALLISLLPALFVENYIFADWLYRGLVFLVISCPCALVISVPLGYFSGIGVASKHGILFKGANYLELMTKITHIAFDKTGTLTKGVFEVKKVECEENFDKNEFIKIVAAVEKHSNHPIAKAVTAYAEKNGDGCKLASAVEMKEISGHGISAKVDNKTVLVGNGKLLKKFEIPYPVEIDNILETTVLVAIEGKFAGYIIIADEIKADSQTAVNQLNNNKIKTILLSGDKETIAEYTAKTLNISEFYGNLLPENKVEILEKTKGKNNSVVAFVGDGINDAPAIALADVGIAMGGLGSDAAIEIADVVIQTDAPSRIFTAINISKSTHNIVVQNIVLALGIKFIVLFLGAFGIVTMWLAVFADVGVALLAILNSIRLIFKKF